MEENINKKNNIQVNALNVGTEKASPKYYSYQNDSTDIIQANTNKFNKNQENSLIPPADFPEEISYHHPCPQGKFHAAA